MPQLDKLSFVTQIFWLSLFFFSLYFFLINFFISEIFKGARLKAIIHKNCTLISQTTLSTTHKLRINNLFAPLLSTVILTVKKFYYALPTLKQRSNEIISLFFVSNTELNDVDENLYFSDLVVLAALTDLKKNEI
jgi:hypothetical protein